MDPTTIQYKSAIKVDYNIHTLDNLDVHDCMASGIDILHNDVYANAKLSNSKITNNLGERMRTMRKTAARVVINLQILFWLI